MKMLVRSKKRLRFFFFSFRSHETNEIYLAEGDSTAGERTLFYVLSHVPLFHLLWHREKEVADAGGHVPSMGLNKENRGGSLPL